MTSIRDILANNLKENRKRCGFSQAKLAEEADTSTQYIAMIEISRKFPTPEMLDRLAEALGIETYELFVVKPSPEDAMERLHNSIISNIERIVAEAVEKAIAEKCK
ncbi:MAG: helix-turn-helix transcriptional regulator [Leptospirales bacterium]|nr:helix-turn-helix transcriptional regulator [Leptospirales bacterium]